MKLKSLFEPFQEENETPNSTEYLYRDWKNRAIRFLYEYAKKHDKFSGEMVRAEAKTDYMANPPMLRSWGMIFVYGAKKGWIKKIGHVKVKNPKAHQANAALWKSLIFENKIKRRTK